MAQATARHHPGYPSRAGTHVEVQPCVRKYWDDYSKKTILRDTSCSCYYVFIQTEISY